jgi:hypothetical protein
VVRVCGVKRCVLKVLIAGFRTLGFLLAICAYYGVWGTPESQAAIRGVGGSLPTTPEKRPTTPAKSILEHIVQDIV